MSQKEVKGRSIVAEMKARYSRCETYRDTGKVISKSAGIDLVLSFATLFKRPNQLRFSWTGFNCVQRGDDYKADLPLHTVVGLWSGRAYRWDPRYSNFQGLEEHESIWQILRDDGAFSNCVASFAVSMLSPEFECFHPDDYEHDYVLWRYATVNDCACYVIRRTDEFGQRDLFIDRETFCLKQCRRELVTCPDPSGLKAANMTRERHRECYSFYGPSFDSEINDREFDPDVWTNAVC